MLSTQCFSLLLILCVPYTLAAKPMMTAGPASPADQPKWLAELQADAAASLKKIDYKGGVFDTPELQWTQTSYIQPQMHPYDNFFYDRATRQYTPAKYLKDVKDRYGGIDSMLMWSAATPLAPVTHSC